MAITSVTKPMALDETLQATNSILATLGLNNIGNMASLTTTDKTSLVGAVNELNAGKVANSEVGVAGGVAELDNTGKVPAAQLPAFVDDVIEGYYYNSEFYYDAAHTQLITPESGKIYVDLTTEKTYRWGGSAYVVISDTLALGETSTTAYRGDRGKTAYDHSQDASRITSAVAEGLYKVGGTAQGHISSMTAVQKADLTALGVADDADVEAIEDKIDETTTSISGNPISISGLKSNQLAVNPIITLEPIQAGSGTPSPSNIRAISGYDKIEVLSASKNIWGENWEVGSINNTTGQNESDATNIRQKDYTVVKPNQAYFLRCATKTLRLYWYDANHDFISTDTASTVGTSKTSPANAKYLRVRTTDSYGSTYGNNITVAEGSHSVDYEPSVKTTSISESLGQTVYGGSLDLRSGKLVVDRQIVDLGDLTYTYNSQYQYFYTEISSMADSGYGLSDRYQVTTASYDGNQPDNSFKMSGTGNKRIFITNRAYNNATTFKTAMVGAKIVYELAEPFTIQLTPHEISLLKDYAYVSTNGTTIALDYHNGELASLADVSQLGETVNELGEYVKDIYGFKYGTFTVSVTANTRKTITTSADIVDGTLPSVFDRCVFSLRAANENFPSSGVIMYNKSGGLDTIAVLINTTNSRLSINWIQFP